MCGEELIFSNAGDIITGRQVATRENITQLIATNTVLSQIAFRKGDQRLFEKIKSMKKIEMRKTSL